MIFRARRGETSLGLRDARALVKLRFKLRIELRFRPRRGQTTLCITGAARRLGELELRFGLGRRKTIFGARRGQTSSLRRGCSMWWGSHGKFSVERNCVSLSLSLSLSLSPHVEKPLNSKRWIKVTYLNQFPVFQIPICLWTLSYLPTPPLGQDMTQGQFLSGV